ncbi:unnamed protein product [Bubo scandiacus]
MAASGTSGGTSCPPTLANPSSWHMPPSPLQLLLERATAIEEELAQGEDKPFTEVTHCHSGDAVATGHQPLTFLQQVAAICAYPQLLDDECVPADAKRRAGQILQHLQGGSPGAYNLEYVTSTVATKVARYLEQRDGGIPSDPRCIVPLQRHRGGRGGRGVAGGGRGGGAAHGGAGASAGPPSPWGGRGAGGGPWPCRTRWPRSGAGPWPPRRCGGCCGGARARCHPKVLCVVNPGDPTGHVLSRQNMEEIIRLAAEENLLLLADEVQQERAFLPGRPFLSFKRVLWEMGAPLASTVQLISFYSLSKGVGGGGYRAGFFELVNIDPRVLRCFYTGVTDHDPAEGGGCVAYPHPHPLHPRLSPSPQHRQALRQDLAHNARRVQEVLGRAPGIHLQPLHGGARAFPRIQLPPRALCQARAQGLEPDVFFCQKLLEATGLVVAPGSEFGQEGGTHHVGLSLLPPAEALERGLLALTRFHAAFLREFS